MSRKDWKNKICKTRRCNNPAEVKGVCKQCYQKYYMHTYIDERVKARMRKAGLSFRLRKYKLSPQEYEELLQKQQGLCAICRRASTGSLHIDHCHKTNKVRGLLCRKCNLALGNLQDSPEVAAAAASYLQTHATT